MYIVQMFTLLFIQLHVCYYFVINTVTFMTKVVYQLQKYLGLNKTPKNVMNYM